MDRVQFLQHIGHVGKNIEDQDLISNFFEQHMILYNMICNQRCTVSDVNVSDDREQISFQLEFESEEDTNLEFPGTVSLYTGYIYYIVRQKLSPTNLLVCMGTSLEKASRIMR